MDNRLKVIAWAIVLVVVAIPYLLIGPVVIASGQRSYREGCKAIWRELRDWGNDLASQWKRDKLEDFTLIKCEGSRCVMEPHEAEGVIKEMTESGDDYTTETVRMTREQFDNLSEFKGF